MKNWSITILSVLVTALVTFPAHADTNVYGVIAWGYDQYGESTVPPALSNVVAIASGVRHSLAVKSDGTVEGWGSNDFGQSSAPPGLSNVVEVSASDVLSLALKGDGKVVAWGHPSYTNVPPSLSNVVAIAAGNAHGLALKSDGTVETFGLSGYAISPPEGLNTVVAIADGYNHSLALKADGTVVSWGRQGNFGVTNVPLGLSNVVAIATGEYVSLAVKADGTVEGWGYDGYGQVPVPPEVTNVVAVAAGKRYCLALRADGTVVGWGSLSGSVPGYVSNISAISAGGFDGLALSGQASADGLAFMSGTRTILGATGSEIHHQLLVANGATGFAQTGLPAGLTLDPATGLISGTPTVSGTFTVNLQITNPYGTSNETLTLTINLPLPGITSAKTLTLMTGADPNYRITTSLPVTGYNATGLAEGLVVDTGTGEFIGAPREVGVFNVVLSATNTYGVGIKILVLETKNVAAWGYDQYGESTVPPALSNVVAIASGVRHSLAVKSDGTVEGWGNNDLGQSSAPPSLSNVVAVSASEALSLALKDDGKVVAWGHPSYTNVPPSLSNVVAIAAGNAHGLALKSDGTVETFGLSGYAISPPEGLNTVVAIADGYNHSLALKADGTVVSWGRQGSFGVTNVPPGLSNVVAIATGEYVSLAVKADGTVEGWGYDYYGQVPVPPEVTNVVAVAAGQRYCLALRADGTVVGWGQLSAPVPGYVSNISAISAGGFDGLALSGQASADGLAFMSGTRTILGATGSEIHHQLLVANGATGFAQTGLPAGLTLDPVTGLISGTPTVSGTFTVNLQITNSYGTSNETLTLTINLPLPGITSPKALMLMVGAEPNYQITTSIPATSFGATGLPAGMGIDTATGMLTGTPLEVGIFNVELSASNSYGSNTDLLVLETKQVAAWGENNKGQITVPPAASNAVAIACGYEHSLAVKADGTVVAWGYNAQGQTNVPVSAINVMAVAATGASSLALKSDGTLEGWGHPSEVAGYGDISNVVAVAAGLGHYLAVKSDATVVAFGATNSAAAPPSGLDGVTEVAVGYGHSLALKADGTVVTWGLNNFGLTNAPAGLSNVVAIAAGDYVSLAVKSNGSVVAWGNTSYGQTNVPARITNAVAVAVGERHCIALLSDGTVDGWGVSYYADAPWPLSNIAAISAGRWHSMALSAGYIPPPVISVNDALVYEKAGSAQVEVVLSNKSRKPVQVDFMTIDQTATAGLDYTGVNGTLTILPGDLSGTVDIPILDDALTEGNESFHFEISNPTYGSISNGVAVVTITETNIIRLGCTVAVFDDPAYVDTGNGYDAESDNLQAALADLGFTVTTFAGTNQSDWVNAFVSAEVVVIPELEKGNLAADLSAATLSEIAVQVAGGKGLLLFPDYYGPEHLVDLCNGVFGWNLAKSSNNFMGESIGLEPGVPLEYSTAPPALSAWAGIVALQRTSLPVGAQVLYAMDSDANAVAAFKAGNTAFLSWDWYDPTLDDANGSAWKQVLGIVLDSLCGN